MRDSYLALGDSITAGYEASRPSLSFVGLVSQYLRTKGLARHSIVIARNGWTSQQLWQACQYVPASLWAKANVVTLMTGGNDLRTLLRAQIFYGIPLTKAGVDERLQDYARNMKLLSEFIARQEIPQVVVATVYNPAPNFPLANYAMDELAEIAKSTATRHGFILTDLRPHFRGQEAHFIRGYRSGRWEDLTVPFRRPIHPNNFGHQAIAQAITAGIESRITTPTRESSSLAQSRHRKSSAYRYKGRGFQVRDPRYTGDGRR